MLNAFVSQKRMFVLHRIFGKRCEPGAYTTPAIWGGGGGWQQPAWENIWQYGYITHAKAWNRAPYQTCPKKMPGALTLPHLWCPGVGAGRGGYVQRGCDRLETEHSGNCRQGQVWGLAIKLHVLGGSSLVRRLRGGAVLMIGGGGFGLKVG